MKGPILKTLINHSLCTTGLLLDREGSLVTESLSCSPPGWHP